MMMLWLAVEVQKKIEGAKKENVEYKGKKFKVRKKY